MKKFSWSKGIGFGVVLWLIMFAVVGLFITYGLYASALSKIILVLLAGVLSYMFSLSAKPVSLSQSFGYGLTWAAVGIFLDIIISTRFNSEIFGSWVYWTAYALILLAPMLEELTMGAPADIRTQAHSRIR